MQFGLFMSLPVPEPVPAAELYQRAIAMAEATDMLGFSDLWPAEHHFTNNSHSSRPLMLLSHIAARTRHLRLGPAFVRMTFAAATFASPPLTSDFQHCNVTWR
jgi:alkanesulfonate monooxygenase SsuD/methylene tetrahydromethanopterin reductase-like flavin-dependent oxidoreductase (luciferase family)